MTFRSRLGFLAVLVLAFARPAAGTPAEDPRYDTTAVVDLRVVVVETREVAKGNPLAGLHMFVRLETARDNSEPLDIYLGPADFIKDFNFPMQTRERLEVVGSRVKVGSVFVVLARELRHEGTTLYIREKTGEPLWKGAA